MIPPIEQKITPSQTRCIDQKLKNLFNLPGLADWEKKDEIINRIKQVIRTMKTFRLLKINCFISAVREENKKSTFKVNQDHLVLPISKRLEFLQQYKSINKKHQDSWNYL